MEAIGVIGQGKWEKYHNYWENNKNCIHITYNNLKGLLQHRYDDHMTADQNISHAIKNGLLPTDRPIALIGFTISLPGNHISAVEVPVIPDNVTLLYDNKIISGAVAFYHGTITVMISDDTNGKAPEPIHLYLCGSDARVVLPIEKTTVPVTVVETTDGAKAVGWKHDVSILKVSDIKLAKDLADSWVRNKQPLDNQGLEALYKLGLAGLSDLFSSLISREDAVRYLKHAAANGHVESMCMLGLHYFTGNKIGQNLELSIQYFRQASFCNNVDADFMLGDIYSSSAYVNQKFIANDGTFQTGGAVAIKYYERAAAKGHTNAQLKIVAHNARFSNCDIFLAQFNLRRLLQHKAT
jgi:hypothetical protein